MAGGEARPARCPQVACSQLFLGHTVFHSILVRTAHTKYNEDSERMKSTSDKYYIFVRSKL